VALKFLITCVYTRELIEFEAAREVYVKLLKYTSEWLARGTTEVSSRLPGIKDPDLAGRIDVI